MPPYIAESGVQRRIVCKAEDFKADLARASVTLPSMSRLVISTMVNLIPRSTSFFLRSAMILMSSSSASLSTSLRLRSRSGGRRPGGMGKSLSLLLVDVGDAKRSKGSFASLVALAAAPIGEEGAVLPALTLGVLASDEYIEAVAGNSMRRRNSTKTEGIISQCLRTQMGEMMPSGYRGDVLINGDRGEWGVGGGAPAAGTSPLGMTLRDGSLTFCRRAGGPSARTPRNVQPVQPCQP